MEEIDYSKEPLRDIFLIDIKSFYASVECAARNLDPLQTMLVVMSTAENTGSGLILASSPKAKEVLGISNVTRANNLPDHPELYKVPPRMKLYIRENSKINNIFRQFVAEEDLLVYSIDESVLDVTQTLNLFIPDETLTRSEKRQKLAKIIADKIYQETHLYITVGIGDNPLLAKLALDNEAKETAQRIAEWTYQDVPTKVWQIANLTDFWGINRKMKKNFEQMGIYSVKELAHSNPYLLKERFGIMGLQYYCHANGIDRTIISEGLVPKEKSYGNNQVLHRDYYLQAEIEVVVKEMAEQVAARIRRHGCQTQCVHLYIGASKTETKKSFSHQMKIPATDNTKELIQHCLFLFRKYYQGQVVRHVGVTYSKLIFTTGIQLSLFEAPEKILADERLDTIIDRIRQKYGFTAIVHGTSILPGSRSIARANLVGGHAGGMDGIDNYE
ncbi:DNA polymerase V [Enterococcus sp. PF1-24]|uniref:Y-family DNA polymerase n=1 Tax=unclassified Enterococcus TaxID=2608891 RepID=UPI00247721E8|nr:MULTISPECIES: Y-family DNA polymerase [unclassified Enterococcus]MDH6365160.1 DNA polymerase V [Enterococcus sp. PFB1-1]MDH6402256.1 DNA polymerase V [Enterococcus sp. PF1-24]